ncbi:MAG: hypothetical protein LBC64_00715 [Fibromonadaceae bacterium]|jgi:hypothetical protein|nr:hypothetical protein [Fibromonadaceae bacterium]
MRNKLTKITLAVGILFALSFTYSCSSDDSAPTSSSSTQCSQPFVWDGEKCSACPAGYEYYNSEPASCVVICEPGFYREGTDCKQDLNWCPDRTSKYQQIGSCNPSFFYKAPMDSLNTCINRINGALKDKCVTSALQTCIENGCKSIKNTKGSPAHPDTKAFNACAVSSYLRDYGYTTCF